MREALLLTAAAGCAMMADLFGKTPDNDWGSVLMASLFAGSAGILLVVAAG
jgi:hypothetical protein